MIYVKEHHPLTCLMLASQEPLRFLEIHYNGGDGPLYGLVGKGTVVIHTNM